MDHENLLIADTPGAGGCVPAPKLSVSGCRPEAGDASLRQSSVCPVADPRQEMRPFAKALHV